MVFILGNLPDKVAKKDIKSLIGHHKKCKVRFLENKNGRPSNYECIVTTDIKDPAAGNILEKQLHNMSWKGSNITVHRLIF